MLEPRASFLHQAMPAHGTASNQASIVGMGLYLQLSFPLLSVPTLSHTVLNNNLWFNVSNSIAV